VPHPSPTDLQEATVALHMFIATHGVQFGDPAEPWAQFTIDDELATPEGERRYKFTTEDAAVAGKLRKVKDYGITEVK
jgi:hypothetical protein